MPHWLEKALHLIEADTHDLRELAILAGGDPRTFYLDTSLDGADLRGQDLRGMKFSNLDLSKVVCDDTTFLDPDIVQTQTKQTDDEISIIPQKNDKYYEKIELIITEARELVKIKEHKKAIKLLLSANKKYPEEIDIILEIAKAYRSANDLGQSLEYYAMAKSFWPRRFVVWQEIGRLLRRMRLYRDAMINAEDMISIFPEYAEGWIELASSLLAMGGTDEAIEILHQGIEHHERNPKIWERLGDVAFKKKDLQLTISAYRTAWGISRRNYSLLHKLCQAYTEIGEHDEALFLIDSEFHRTRPNIKLSKLYIENLIKSGRIRESELIYREAISSKNRNPANLKWMADTLWKEEARRKSMHYYERLVLEFPDAPPAWKWFGEALLRNHENSKALEVLREGASKHSHIPAPLKWLSEALVKSGKIREAARVLEHAKEKFPHDKFIQTWQQNILPKDTPLFD